MREVLSFGKRQTRNLLILLVLVLGSVLLFFSPLSSSSASVEGSNPVLTVGTDKTVYTLGEEVVITVTNISTEIVGFPNLQKVEILNDVGTVVYPPLIQPAFSYLDPNESEVYLWNQKDWNGDPVPRGEYTAVTYSELPEVDEAWAKFWIDGIPVGGVVELLVDGSESPARAAEAAGSSGPPYALLAGATAAALALAAGGWYARRRWLR